MRPIEEILEEEEIPVISQDEDHCRERIWLTDILVPLTDCYQDFMAALLANA